MSFAPGEDGGRAVQDSKDTIALSTGRLELVFRAV